MVSLLLRRLKPPYRPQGESLPVDSYLVDRSSAEAWGRLTFEHICPECAFQNSVFIIQSPMFPASGDSKVVLLECPCEDPEYSPSRGQDSVETRAGPIVALSMAKAVTITILFWDIFNFNPPASQSMSVCLSLVLCWALLHFSLVVAPTLWSPRQDPAAAIQKRQRIVAGSRPSRRPRFHQRTGLLLEP